MDHLQLVADNVDVIPLLLALKRQPELWDQHTQRKDNPQSDHREMQDIWVRYNDISKVDDISKINDMHFPVWYDAYYKLPELRPIIFGLMSRVQGSHLGGVLITKIPPGGRIYPHKDHGWHTEHYNTKLYVVLQSNEKCISRVEDSVVCMQQGEVWWFDNTKEHEVINSGKDDRIVLVVCVRCE